MSIALDDRTRREQTRFAVAKAIYCKPGFDLDEHLDEDRWSDAMSAADRALGAVERTIYFWPDDTVRLWDPRRRDRGMWIGTARELRDALDGARQEAV